MIGLQVKDLGHRFRRRWVFRNLELQIDAGNVICLTGPNGSGKSTLMRILAGQLNPTHGQVAFTKVSDNNSKGAVSIEPEYIWKHLSWMAPYIEHFPFLKLNEAYRLHHRLRPLYHDPEACIEKLQLSSFLNLPLGQLSSGLRQRALVGLALFTQSEMLLLDEPSSFLDPDNARFLFDLIEKERRERTLVIASNLPEEYERYAERFTLAAN